MCSRSITRRWLRLRLSGVNDHPAARISPLSAHLQAVLRAAGFLYLEKGGSMQEMTATLTIEVPIRYSIRPGRPGRTSGPPELCYPEEDAEWDIEIEPGTNLLKIVEDAIDVQAVDQIFEDAENRTGLWGD